jgi:hypothetical protein
MNVFAAPLPVLSELLSSLPLYRGAVFVHVLAAVVLMASSLSFLVIRSALRRAASVEELRGWLDAARMSAAANPIAALVLLATGLLLGAQGWWREAWFHVALAVFVLDVAWAVRVVHRSAGELGRAAAEVAPGPVPGELDRLRWSPDYDLPHDVLLGGDLALLFVMVVKLYDAVVAMTQGGPGTASEVPGKFIMDYLFNRANIGLASAASIVLLATVLAVLAPVLYARSHVSAMAARRGERT